MWRDRLIDIAILIGALWVVGGMVMTTLIGLTMLGLISWRCS